MGTLAGHKVRKLPPVAHSGVGVGVIEGVKNVGPALCQIAQDGVVTSRHVFSDSPAMARVLRSGVDQFNAGFEYPQAGF